GLGGRASREIDVPGGAVVLALRLDRTRQRESDVGAPERVHNLAQLGEVAGVGGREAVDLVAPTPVHLGAGEYLGLDAALVSRGVAENVAGRVGVELDD